MMEGNTHAEEDAENPDGALSGALFSTGGAGQTTVVKIDVGGKNDDNADYAIEDNRIILRKRDTVFYELTGTTDKKKSAFGAVISLRTSIRRFTFGRKMSR